MFENYRLKAFKMSTAAFARKLGVERHNYINYVTGRRKTRDDTIARMVEKLNEMLVDRIPGPDKNLVELNKVLDLPHH